MYEKRSGCDTLGIGKICGILDCDIGDIMDTFLKKKSSTDGFCVFDVIMKTNKFEIIVFISQILPIAEQTAIGSCVEGTKDKSICCLYRHTPILHQ